MARNRLVIVCELDVSFKALRPDTRKRLVVMVRNENRLLSSKVGLDLDSRF